MSDIIKSNVEWFDRNAATPEMKRLADERDAYKRSLVMVLNLLREFVTKQANAADVLEQYCMGQAEVAGWLQRELALAKAQLPKDHEAVQAVGFVDGVSMPPFITDGHGNSWLKTCMNCGKPTMVVIRPGKAQCSECG